MNLQFKFIPRENNCPVYAYYDNIFSREELDKLQHIAKSAEIPAVVGMQPGQSELNTGIRRSKIKWAGLNQDTFWFFQKLSVAITRLNCDFYNYDIDGFGEDIQFTNYESNDSGTYDWHIDRGSKGDFVRKISIIMQLSEPGEYEGGELQLLENSDKPITVEKIRGRLIIFPSHTIHRVTPVTVGNRQSLVAWLCGPPLR